MATPSTYPLSSDDLLAEFSELAYPLSSDDLLGIASGVPTAYPLSSDDLLGISGIVTWVKNMSFVATPYDPGSGKFPQSSGGNTRAGDGSTYPAPAPMNSSGTSVSIGHNNQAYSDPNILRVYFFQTNSPPPDVLHRVHIPDIGWKTAASATKSVSNPVENSYRSYSWVHNSNSAAEAGGTKTITMEFNA